jgi:hypothetical protein
MRERRRRKMGAGAATVGSNIGVDAAAPSSCCGAGCHDAVQEQLRLHGDDAAPSVPDDDAKPEPSPGKGLLASDAPRTSVSLDGLAMVGTTHAHKRVRCFVYEP